MKSGKTIDISKSSLISLKAELSRKRDEIKNIKVTESYVKLPPKPKEPTKKNVGVEERNRKDTELDAEEIDLLKKSREVLAVKSRLYDELHKGNFLLDEKQNNYLVDFKNKEALESTPSCSFDNDIERDSPSVFKGEHLDEVSNDASEVEDSEWVEYTDCLGRTRKCHKSDLAEMKEIDKNMAREMIDRNATIRTEDTNRDRPPELLSSDMEREMFRQKWEEQEKELLKKKDVHYEDILFDEARSHGVGYFKFSQDEERRQAEQEMLRRVREETEARQREAKLLRERRDAQRQARLIAARQRQRARLGLSPLSQEDILKEFTPTTKVEEEEEDVIGPLPVEDLESKLMRAAHVRPWDVGKDKVEKPVMTQEEWIEKKRDERTNEFAPIYSETSAKVDVTQPPPLIKRHKPAHEPLIYSKNKKEDISTEAAIEAGLMYIREQVELQRSAGVDN